MQHGGRISLSFFGGWETVMLHRGKEEFQRYVVPEEFSSLLSPFRNLFFRHKYLLFPPPPPLPIFRPPAARLAVKNKRKKRNGGPACRSDQTNGA